MIDWGLLFLERGLVPDFVTRRVIRGLLRERLEEAEAGGDEAVDRFEAELRRSPIALDTEAANEQHYGVPSEFTSRC